MPLTRSRAWKICVDARLPMALPLVATQWRPLAARLTTRLMLAMVGKGIEGRVEATDDGGSWLGLEGLIVVLVNWSRLRPRT